MGNSLNRLREQNLSLDSSPEDDSDADASRPPAALTWLRWLTMRIPPIPHASGLSNRIVKPFWLRIAREQPVVLPVWGKTRMLLHPADTVGGNLTFIPQLWDRWERNYIRTWLKPGAVFIDVGSNIGAYSLWAAEIVGPAGTVIAIEPDPETAEILRRNIALNRWQSVISVCRMGVSDREEILLLERPCTGDMGVTRLVSGCGGGGAPIACLTLATILRQAGVSRVDMLKIDIEGSETRVLREFFKETQSEIQLRPEHLLVEFDEGPLSQADKRSLAELIRANGYKLVHSGPNAVFRRA
jgi:FkbM family methyltransferase